MKDQLRNFLIRVADGDFGESNLNISRINAYFNKATKQDIKELEEFFWGWTSQISDENDIDVEELEEHIYEVINR